MTDTLPPGRYAMDAEGRLHPERHARFVRAVAFVTIKAKAQPAADPKSQDTCSGYSTADNARGREGRAPEGSRGSAAGLASPSNARQVRQHLPDQAMDRIKSLIADGLKDDELVIDAQRYAEACRARKKVDAPAPRKVVQQPRDENFECPYCGTAGTRECDHFAAWSPRAITKSHRDEQLVVRHRSAFGFRG